MHYTSVVLTEIGSQVWTEFPQLIWLVWELTKSNLYVLIYLPVFHVEDYLRRLL